MSVNYDSTGLSLEDLPSGRKWYQSDTIDSINLEKDFPRSDEMFQVGNFNFERNILEPIANKLRGIEGEIDDYFKNVDALTQLAVESAQRILEEEEKERLRQLQQQNQKNGTEDGSSASGQF